MSAKLARYDSVAFPKMIETQEGYLQGSATVTRCGVFEYYDAAGKVRWELRHEDDVFCEKSLKTLVMKPVTNDHPYNDFLSAENATKYQVGYTGEKYDRLGDAVVLTLTITDKETIDAIKNGKNKVSMGYTADTVLEKGVYNGIKYDCRQTNIEYNHLSIVMSGRAGDSIRLRFDGSCVSSEIFNMDKLINKGSNMDDNNKKLNLDALEIKKDILEKDNELLQIRLDAALAKCSNIEEGYAKLKKELEIEKTKKTDSLIKQAVDNKVSTLVEAAPYLGDIKMYFDHSIRDIQIEVINSKRKDHVDFSDKDDSFINGLFCALIDTNDSKHRDSRSALKVLKTYDMSGDISVEDIMLKKIQDEHMLKTLTK